MLNLLERKKEMAKTGKPKPQVGQTCTVYGQRCRILKVEYYGSFGNIVVETLNGERNYRLTGLSWSAGDGR
jgi:hypothetical protein